MSQSMLRMQIQSIPTDHENDQRRAKLKHAAGEFEAQMMSELLKPMQDDPLFSDGADASGSSLTIQGMATQALGQAMAAQGGIGIAAKVMNSVREQPEKITAVTGSISLSGGYSQTGKLVTGHSKFSLND